MNTEEATELKTENAPMNEDRSSIVKNWARPNIAEEPRRSSRPKLRLRLNDRICGNRGRLEIKLKPEGEEIAPIALSDFRRKRSSFKLVFAAGVRRRRR